MFFGIPLTPFNAINFGVLAAAALVAWIRYSRGSSSNLPLLFWAGLFAHTRAFSGGFQPGWISAGVFCALMLRFEFMNERFEKVFQLGEFAAIVYVVYRAVGLILLW